MIKHPDELTSLKPLPGTSIQQVAGIIAHAFSRLARPFREVDSASAYVAGIHVGITMAEHMSSDAHIMKLFLRSIMTDPDAVERFTLNSSGHIHDLLASVVEPSERPGESILAQMCTYCPVHCRAKAK